jgi:hypothetical protein
MTPNARISKGYGNFGARRLAGSDSNHEPFWRYPLTPSQARRPVRPAERKSLISQGFYRLLPSYAVAVRAHGGDGQDHRDGGRCDKPQWVQVYGVGEACQPTVQGQGGGWAGDQIGPENRVGGPPQPQLHELSCSGAGRAASGNAMAERWPARKLGISARRSAAPTEFPCRGWAARRCRSRAAPS